jgi:arabinan endo-1,5-alpha-L-arabinosidase
MRRDGVLVRLGVLALVAGWLLGCSSGGTNVGGGSSPPALVQSVVTLSATPTAAVQGLPVRLQATVASGVGSSSTQPTGTVTLTRGGVTLASVAIDPGGTANFTDTKLPVGGSSVTASYSGNTIYGASTSGAVSVSVSKAAATTFTNPLTLNVTNSNKAVSCADPAIYKDQEGGADTWYLYCTSDTLYAGDATPNYVNIFQSADLVNFSYDGSAFAGFPSWANNVSGAALWAPAIKYFNGQYMLYYASPVSNAPANGAEIGVGTSASPAGPFVDHGTPVVDAALATNCCAGQYRSMIDPDEVQDSSGQRYLLFGSFEGGLFVRKLSADGFTSDPASEQQVGIDHHYEGGNWWFHGGYYYLFASSQNCCNGPLSGYGVFVGRAATPMGPYLDANGVSMAAATPRGTAVLEMNGNSVVGPGGNVIFTDEAGQDYILYHGIQSSSPYYAGQVGYTARLAYLDAMDWVNGWPVARGGYGPSDADAPQPLPAAQPGATNSYVTALASTASPGVAIAALSDEFNSTTLSSHWSNVHSAPAYTLTGSAYQAPTVNFDTTNAMASVPLLAEASPVGDFMVETQLTINLPVSGEGYDYAQAGLLIYGDDNDYVRLDLFSNSDTRSIEFIKQETAVAAGYSTWGATALGPAAIGTSVSAWLRIVKRNVNGEEHYEAYSSPDDVHWTESGTWVHSLGTGAKICLYAGNRAGYTASFDYVHVSTLQ